MRIPCCTVRFHFNYVCDIGTIDASREQHHTTPLSLRKEKKRTLTLSLTPRFHLSSTYVLALSQSPVSGITSYASSLDASGTWSRRSSNSSARSVWTAGSLETDVQATWIGVSSLELVANGSPPCCKRCRRRSLAPALATRCISVSRRFQPIGVLGLKLSFRSWLSSQSAMASEVFLSFSKVTSLVPLLPMSPGDGDIKTTPTTFYMYYITGRNLVTRPRIYLRPLILLSANLFTRPRST